MEKTTLEIGNVQNVLLILGSLYSPVDAASEYFANSMDAHAKNIEILFGKDTKGSYVLFSDDGDGIDYDGLRRVAKNIGNSIKKIETNSDSIGQFGIGILGFVTFGDEMHIVSRKNATDILSELIVNKGIVDCVIETSKRKNLKLSKDHGTDVYIYYKEKTPLRSNHLVTHISEKYRHSLLKNPINAIVKTGRNRTYEIRAFVIRGTSIYSHKFKTNYGDITFQIYLSDYEASNSPIKIIRKGVVICNLTDIDEFKRNPWNHKKITGEIIFDSLEITADRKSVLQNDPQFDIFKEKVLFIEKTIDSYIEEQKRQKTELFDRHLKKQLNEIIHQALSMLNEPLELFERKKPTIEKYKHPIIGQNSKNLGFISYEEVPITIDKNHKKERDTNENSYPPHQAEDKIVKLDDFDDSLDANTPQILKPQNRSGINWELNSEEFQDEPWKMSKYDSTLNLILINDSHTYWKDIQKTDERYRMDLRSDYTLALTLKEIIIYNLQSEAKQVSKKFESTMELYIRFMIKTRELLYQQNLLC
jgi:hypothetical protein